MTGIINPTGVNFCISARERLAEVRTHMEWLTSGSAPAFPIDEELDGLASKIWDVERMLKDFARQSDGNARSAPAAVMVPGPPLSNTASVIQMGQRNDRRSPSQPNETWIEAIA